MYRFSAQTGQSSPSRVSATEEPESPQEGGRERVDEKQERELKEKLAKKKAKLDAATRRLRARAAAIERKQDTRRKILAGAWVLARAAKDQEAARQLTQGLDGFLERDRDRALFNLGPRPTDAG